MQDNRRNALTNQLTSIIASIEDAIDAQNIQTRIRYCQNAIDQLTELQAKTDGCTLRDAPDVPGSKYTPDWVSGFTAQLYLYQVSNYCLTELQTLLENAYANA